MKFKAEILIAVIVAWAVALLALAAGMPLLPVIVLALITSSRRFSAAEKSRSEFRERDAQANGAIARPICSG